MPAPRSHTHYTPPCTNEYLANEAPVAPGVGNRLHSLHSPHPAPPGLGAARRGMRKLLPPPHSLRGPGGSGLAEGAGPHLRMGVQHPESILDPRPKEVPGSTDLLKDTPQGRSCFQETFAKPRANKLCSKLCPEPAQ